MKNTMISLALATLLFCGCAIEKELPMGGSFVPLSEVSTNITSNYNDFLAQDMQGIDNIYYLLFVDKEDKPVANLRCFTPIQWEEYLRNSTSSLSGLSMNSGLMPIQIADIEKETKLIIANTDVDEVPIYEEIILTDKQLKKIKSDFFLKLYWQEPTPNSTVKTCKKTATLTLYKDYLENQLDTNVLSYIDINKGIYEWVIPASFFQLEDEDFPPEWYEKEFVQVTPKQLSAIVNKEVFLPPFKEIFDPRYTDENGVVTFKINYMPDELDRSKKMYELSDGENRHTITYKNQIRLFSINNIFDNSSLKFRLRRGLDFMKYTEKPNGGYNISNID